MPGIGQLGTAAPDSSGAASTMAREAAEALATRCISGMVAYPAIVLTTGLVTPGIDRRLWFVLPWGLLVLLSVAVRLALVLPFERRYTPDPARWRRNFRAGAYLSIVLWVVYALEEMDANGSAWPTWMILLMTAGLAAGATSSLCPDPPLLYGYLLFLLTPLVCWGLREGGNGGYAIAIAASVYLAFIMAQARHGSRVFRQSMLDKEALREAGRRRDALIHSIDGIVWEADPQTRRFTFVSRRAEAILGYSVERWLQDPTFWRDRIHPADRESTVARVASAVAAGQDYTVEYRMLAADGRAVWLRDIVRAGREGEGGGALCGVMVDVTAHKQAHEERNMLADALRTVREAVAISGLDDRILFVNDAFLDLHGYTRDEILSGSIRQLRSPRNPPELDAAIAEATRRGGWQGEVWSRRKDGSEFPISLSTSLVRDPSGNIVAQIGVATDITARKRVEEEWKRAKEAAEAASRAKSEFLANLSHEIRTPMNGIVGMNRLLLDTALDHRQRRYAEVVRDSAGFLLSVLNDILDFSRMEAGQLALETADFDLHAVLGGVADLLAAKAQEKGIELVFRIDAGVPTELRGDAGRLRQVLANLVGNGVKFTEAGEVAVRVRLESAGEPAVLRFEATDTGIGVPPDKQKLLFEPFSQVDGSSTRRHGGTGLGLTIVRRLAEMMGGQAGYHSREGGGSCFWFTAAFSPQASQPAVTQLTGRRVLVVERNDASRALLAGLLEDWGCRAELAAGGETAIARLRASAEPFDAVLVDSGVVLPGSAGAPMGQRPTESDEEASGRGIFSEAPTALPAAEGCEGGVGDSPASLRHAASFARLAGETPCPTFDRRSEPRASASGMPDGGTPDPRPLWRALSEDPALAGTPVVPIFLYSERLHLSNRLPAGCTAAIARPVKQRELAHCLASLFHALPTISPVKPPARRAVTLLVVEDNPTNQELAAGILEQLGYDAVKIVSDGRQALAALAGQDFDLVLMDCQMPVMDGYEATRRIRNGPDAVRNRRVPIVAVTAHALPGDRERCLEAGMDDYLAKPVDPQLMKGVLERWLAAAAPQAEAARAPSPPPEAGCEPPAEPDFLRSIAIQRTGEGVVVTDAEASIQYVNECFTRMTGYAAEEVLGKNPRLLQSGRQSKEYYREMWETIRAGQVWSGEMVDRRKDGSEYTEEITITPLRNPVGAITNYVAVKVDPNARRADENAQRILAAIVESSEDAILSHTPEGIVTSWNRGAERVYGYTAREALGESVAMLVPPDLVENLRPALQRLAAGEAISQLDCTGLSKDGRRINLSVSSSPIYDAAGRVISIAVVVRDITARRRSQDALVEREEQFRTLFADAPVGIARVSIEGSFLQVNAVLCGILGYSEQELMGKRWADLTHPDDLESNRKSQNALLASSNPRVQLEKRYIGKQGNPIPVRLCISVVRNAQGDPRHFIIHVEDIGESVRAKQALQASEERYRTLFTRNLAGVFRTTVAGQVLDCNQAAAAILGFGSPAELIGGNLGEFHDSQEKREEMVQRLLQQKVVTNWEVKLRRRDGTPVWVLANIGLMNDTGDGLLEGTIIDITDRKQAEDQLRAAVQAAEHANQAKSAFLANMSHEIRTPMNGILGMAGLLLDGGLDPRQRKRAETVRDSAEALLGILNDILDFSKIGAGKLTLESAPFDLRKLVEGVTDMLAVKAQEKGVELLCFIEPDVSTQLLGDPSRLRQILVNLAGNAVKFTARGEVSIRVRLAETAGPARIRFEVDDTGAGIPEDKRHLLFQPFSQVDSSTARRYGGTGLGLSIVRMLVDMMGGELGFESQEGKGSHFWFAVPLERQAAVDRARPLSLAGRRVLVVDDNAASRRLIMELLASWKARGEQAASAPAALDLLQSNTDRPFDAVVADLDTLGPEWQRFPSMVRPTRAAGPALLLMVPLSQSADGGRWTSVGFAGHVAKPVKQGELGASLASLLGYGPPPVRSALAMKLSRPNREARARLRLLVVEDNQVNQEVALGVLENLGYRAEVVGDGRSALDALARSDYDLVLMDCHLPGMDGYEASRLIRLPDTPVRNHQIAIVATTANAMAGDREKCLAAGMNGYVSKPLRPEELERAIEEWTGRIPPAAKPAAPPPLPAAVPSESVFDRQNFLNRVMGNEQLAQRILRRFVNDMPGQIALLAAAVEGGDSKQVRLLAHSIKGAAASVGGMEIREVAWNLEQKAVAGDLTSADAALPELSATFERVRPIMESFCSKDPDHG